MSCRPDNRGRKRPGMRCCRLTSVPHGTTTGAGGGGGTLGRPQHELLALDPTSQQAQLLTASHYLRQQQQQLRALASADEDAEDAMKFVSTGIPNPAAATSGSGSRSNGPAAGGGGVTSHSDNVEQNQASVRAGSGSHSNQQ